MSSDYSAVDALRSTSQSSQPWARRKKDKEAEPHHDKAEHLQAADGGYGNG